VLEIILAGRFTGSERDVGPDPPSRSDGAAGIEHGDAGS
jgi:hypothetical protein